MQFMVRIGFNHKAIPQGRCISSDCEIQFRLSVGTSGLDRLSGGRAKCARGDKVHLVNNVLHSFLTITFSGLKRLVLYWNNSKRNIVLTVIITRGEIICCSCKNRSCSCYRLPFLPARKYRLLHWKRLPLFLPHQHSLPS